MESIIFLLILLGIFGFYLAKIYNDLNTLEGRVERNFSGVDIVLEERHNILTKLKGVVSQEKKNLREQFERLAELIEYSGDNKNNRKEYFETENEISRLWIQITQLPEIQQVGGFKQLSSQIIDLEREIAAARRTYNGSVERLNGQLRSFPNGFIAQILFQRLKTAEFFKATQATRKDVDMNNWS